MIVKILGNKGGGSAGAAIDYMLGKDRDREKARLISGDPDLTARIADNLDFQNRYTVGVLSFEEVDLPEKQKDQIMQDFEKTILAGLERDQYDITWIEHTDKGRLELNFIIPNVELSTGKRLQPYYDKVDRPLVENWKQKTNFEYKLSDPHAPEKAQAIKVLNTQHLPKNVKEIKEKIGLAIADQISQGMIKDRKDVIDTLEKAGFEIARQTERSISIKNPDGQRNIRLEGKIYENRQFDQQFAEEHSRARTEYQGTSRERYETALGRLQSLVESKQQANGERFKDQSRVNTARTLEDQKHHTLEYIYRDSAGRINHRDNFSTRSELVLSKQFEREETRVSRDQSTNRSDSVTSTSTSESYSHEEPRQIYFDNSQKLEESRSREAREQPKTDFKISKLENNPFDRTSQHEPTQMLRDIDYLFDDEISKTKPQEVEVKRLESTTEKDHAQRLHESLQRIIRLIREAVERAKADKLKSERADRVIDQSKRTIISANTRIEHSERAINLTEQTIERTESIIEQCESDIQQIQQDKVTTAFIGKNFGIGKEINNESKDRDTGFDMEM